MEAVFLKLVNMSITASYLVAAVLVLRLVLKKAPKAIHCALWALVAVRLLFPFSLESMFSLIPSAEPLPQEFLYAAAPQMQTGISSLDQAINPVIAESLAPAELTSANPTQILSFVISQLWILGVVLMLLYAVISYILVRRKVRVCIALDKTVHLCDHIETPFILGIIRPKIYLPSELDPLTAGHVLAHEQAHLKRRDHWWKPLGFALLSVYWFNPVLWLAYILLCRDIEQACDEKVVKALDTAGRKAYSVALLECSIPRRMIAACPLAFGEVGVKSRIQSVLNYKKPAFWVILLAVLACVAAAVCFLTDPQDERPTAYEITSDLWIYDASAVDATVRDENGTHQVHFTRPQINEICQILHDLQAHEFVKRKPSAHLIYAEIQCDNFVIELHWDGEYTYFTFDAVTNERITSNRRSVKNETLNDYFNQVMQLDYRPAVGTYVPIAAASLYGEVPDVLSLIDNYRFEVTGSGLTVSDLGTDAIATYDVAWSWKDYREARKQLAGAFELALFPDYTFDLQSTLNDSELKYQYLYDNCHMIFQNDALYIIDGTERLKDGKINWTVYELTEYTPYLILPETYEEFFENASGYTNHSLAFVRSGDRRPGMFGLTEEEINSLSTILAQMPAEAVQPGGKIKGYYINVSLGARINADYYCDACFWYYNGEVGMYWNSYGQKDTQYYHINHAPLKDFLEGMMQPQRINSYGLMIDTSDPVHVTTSHEDISITLLKSETWDYEIVPYVDDQTAFGIRCKPEWLDDWLFFGYMPGGIDIGSTGLYRSQITYETTDHGDQWCYLFETPGIEINDWREWPEPWRMFYMHADNGTYFIYNEGSYDERLSEHDRGGYQYIARSFCFQFADHAYLINSTREYVNQVEYGKPEVVRYDAKSNSFDIAWYKRDSDGYIIVNIDSCHNRTVTEVAGTENE